MEWKETTIAFSFTGRIVVRPWISEQAEEVGGLSSDLGGSSRPSLDGHAAPIRVLRLGEQEGPARHVSVVGDRRDDDRVRQNTVHPAWKVLIIVIPFSCDL